MSSSLSGSYTPSLLSKRIVPDSKHSVVCHCPTGMIYPCSEECASMIKDSSITPSSEKISCRTLPLSNTTVSVDFVCLWIGTIVPGSNAFKMRCEWSSLVVRRSKEARNLVDALALAVNSFNNSSLISCIFHKLIYHTPRTGYSGSYTPAQSPSSSSLSPYRQIPWRSHTVPVRS